MDPDAQLALLGGDDLAGDAEQIAEVEIHKRGQPITQGPLVGKELDPTRAILQDPEAELAEIALAHEPPGHRNHFTGRSLSFEISESGV